MSDFRLYRLHRDNFTLHPLGIVCEDWDETRITFKKRGRSKNEQFIVIHNGLIHAVERADGNGFAMVSQDRQNSEDHYWYPGAK